LLVSSWISWDAISAQYRFVRSFFLSCDLASLISESGSALYVTDRLILSEMSSLELTLTSNRIEQKPATLIHSTHTFIPPLPPHFLIGFPLLALRVAESRRGSWALPFLPRLSPFTAWLTNLLDPRRAERLGGSLLDGFINEKEEEEEERKELRKGGLMGTGVNGAGFWFGKGGERGAREGEGLVALNLHGGAYLTGSGLEGDGTGNHPKYLIARTPLEHVLHIEVRSPSFSSLFNLSFATQAYALSTASTLCSIDFR
jgi:hypothetical protein